MDVPQDKAEALSLRDRIARMRPPVARQSQAALPASPGARPPVPAPPQPTYAQVTGKRERELGGVTAGEQGNSVFERMSRIGARPTALPKASAQGAPARLAWEDPKLPAGSVFTTQEWDAARKESGFARTIVIEIHKAAEKALISLDAAAALPVLHPSILDGALLIDERLKDHPAWHNADGFMQHRSDDLGTWRYRIVHSADALAANPWIHGARCFLGDAEREDDNPAPAPRG